MSASDDGLDQDLRRERLLDIELRLSRYRRLAFAVLATALLVSGPWLGWWWLLPLAGAGAAFWFADRRLAASEWPQRWAAFGWAVSPLMIAMSVALTGGIDSPAVPWFALPALTLAARFERRGTLFGAAYLFSLLGLSTVALETGFVADDPTVLIFPIALVLAAMILSSAIVQSDREHRRRAVVDPLTGLLNRTALAQRIDELEQQSSSRGGGEPISLLVGDLDHFKRINDQRGHLEGDAVLRDVAYAMRGALRAFDLIYRQGGEEFLILLPGADREHALLVAERVRQGVAHCSKAGLPVSISLGAATHDGASAFRFDELHAEADAALYAAKRDGRDRVHAAEIASPADLAVA